MAVGRVEPRVVGAHLARGEHRHAVGRRRDWGGPEAVDEVLEQLAGAERLDPQTGPDQEKVRRFGPHRARGAEWADDLVVPHVHDKQIGLKAPALPGNGQHRMRVDRRHGGIDHLEPLLRVTRAQHHLENAREAICRVGETHRRRFTEYEDPIGPRRLQRRHDRRQRFLHQPGRKETPAEVRVIGPDGRALPWPVPLDKEAHGVAVAAQAQARLEQHEQRCGDQRDGGDAVQPFAPAPGLAPGLRPAWGTHFRRVCRGYVVGSPYVTVHWAPSRATARQKPSRYRSDLTSFAG